MRTCIALEPDYTRVARAEAARGGSRDYRSSPYGGHDNHKPDADLRPLHTAAGMHSPTRMHVSSHADGLSEAGATACRTYRPAKVAGMAEGAWQ